MVNIAIFASGNGSNFENIVTAASNQQIHNAKCCLLVVDKEHAFACERAKKLGIPYLYVNPKAYANKAEYESFILSKLQEYHIDLIVLAGYMRFVGEVLLQAFPYRIVNLHPAYLPQFPGAHSIQDAFEAKVDYTGVTVHYVDEGVDTGEIIYQEKLMIDSSWSLEVLEKHVHELEYHLFPKAIQMVIDKIENNKEDHYETSIG